MTGLPSNPIPLSPCGKSCVPFLEGSEPVTCRWRSYESSLVRCSDCGHLTFWPIPPDPALAEYYRSQYWEENSAFSEAQSLYSVNEYVTATVSAIHSSWLAYGSQCNQPLRLHDIGCGYGAVVNSLRKAGVNATGSDLSASSIRIAQRLGNQHVVTSNLHEYLQTAEAQGINFFFLSHSLEHMPRPRDMMTVLYDNLVDGGLVLVRVPNAMYFASRLHSIYEYQWLQYPDHLHLFSPRSLTCLLTQCGFQIVDVSTLTREDNPDRAMLALLSRKWGQLPNPIKLLEALADNLLASELQVIARRPTVAEPGLTPLLGERLRLLESHCHTFIRQAPVPSQNSAEFRADEDVLWRYSCRRHDDDEQHLYSAHLMRRGIDGKSLDSASGARVHRNLWFIPPGLRVEASRRLGPHSDASISTYRISVDAILPHGDATSELVLHFSLNQAVFSTEHVPASVRDQREYYVSGRPQDTVTVAAYVVGSNWPAFFLNIQVMRVQVSCSAW